MCGIIGYIGGNDVGDILLKGLSRLEYRGYDSAGIVLIEEDGRFDVIKKEGRLYNLVGPVHDRAIKGCVGVGHTRWATHGRPSDVNSHPHGDASGSVWLVHNGIIENYRELSQSLVKKGHRFLSETDSEIIAHLIGDEFSKGEVSLHEAVRRVVSSVRGSYALGIVHRDFPDRIIAARHGSPLIIGIGENENYIASDVPAIMDRTRKVIYLEDGEVAIVKKDSVKVFDLNGNPVNKVPCEVNWSIEEAEKGGYEKFMLKEIFEQPKAVENTIIDRIGPKGKTVTFDDMEFYPQQARKLRRIYIVSCGTAFYAGYTGKYILERLTSIPVEIELASEFRYSDPKLQSDSLVIAVSQSGETADTLASLRMARENGCKVLSIVNVVGSTISRESDWVLYTYAGPEIGVASTKAYVTQLTAFYLFAIYLGEMRGDISSGFASGILDELKNIPGKISKILEHEADIRKCAKSFYKAESALYIGRNFNYPNAMEGALKIKEISYMHAEGYAAGEMKHGPIALIEDNYPVICICTKGKTYEKMISNIREVEARNGQVIAIANNGDSIVREIAHNVIEVPEAMEELSPLLNVVPLQLLAYYVACERGCDIDKPRNLAKSVTVE
ncbi:MAG: glutamine--fructose-6-phosphate transaminase (isomerizing) [Candidatus Theseobacter exili]|nr:glutamine--fructose-6-phosphate transaminase (isomerizing) [Candidatus Theseobacter exili]